MHWWEAGREGMSTCMIDGRRRHLCLYVLRLHISNLGLLFWKSTVFFMLFVPYRYTHCVSPLCLYRHHSPSSIFLTPSLINLQAHNKLWCSNAPGEFFFTLTTSPLSLPSFFPSSFLPCVRDHLARLPTPPLLPLQKWSGAAFTPFCLGGRWWNGCLTKGNMRRGKNIKIFMDAYSWAPSWALTPSSITHRCWQMCVQATHTHTVTRIEVQTSPFKLQPCDYESSHTFWSCIWHLAVSHFIWHSCICIPDRHTQMFILSAVPHQSTV